MKIIVIGAGISGLSAARSARRAGHDVQLWEARPRAGGRVDTRVEADGTAYELGAQVIHGSRNAVLREPAFHSAARPVDRTTGRAWFQLGPQRLDFGRATTPVAPTMLANRLRVMHARLRAIGAPDVSAVDAGRMLGADRESLEVLWSWYEQVTGARPEQVPLSEIATERVYQYHGDQEARLPNGIGTVLQTWATELDARYSTAVREIEPHDGGATVHATGPDGSLCATADIVVLTVPPPVVANGSLRILGLPQGKMEAASGLRAADVAVVAVRLAEAVDTDVFVHDVDGCGGFVTGIGGTRRLVAIAKGSAAGRLRAALARPDLLRDRLSSLLPEVCIDPNAPLDEHDWGYDEFALGGFTAPHARNAEWAAEWARPWGPIRFAGEATAAGTGSPFLDRAFVSGRTAAASIDSKVEVP